MTSLVRLLYMVIQTLLTLVLIPPRPIDKGEIAWDKDTIIEYYDAVGEEVNKTFQIPCTTTSHLHITGKIIATGLEIVVKLVIYYKETLCNPCV